MKHWIAVDPKDDECLKFLLQHPLLNNKDCFSFEQESEADNITLYFQTKQPLDEEDQSNLLSAKGVLNYSFNEEEDQK